MKNILLISLLVCGCGSQYSPAPSAEPGPSGPQGKTGEPGTSIVGAVGPAGEPGVDGQTIVGPRGISGERGQDGLDAQSCSVTETINGAILTCPNGSATIKNGQDGADGIGVAGSTGKDAEPCFTSETEDGAVINCPGSQSHVSNGKDGESIVGPMGPQGLPGESIVGPQGPAGEPGQDTSSVEAIKLCADGSSGFPEYGIKIGSYLYAVYYGHMNTHGNPGSGPVTAFLTRVVPGTYQSTNGTGCLFTVQSDGSITH